MRGAIGAPERALSPRFRNMTVLTESLQSVPVPEIVRVILAHLERQRRDGDISPNLYDEKLNRLCREELGPRGFVLLERPLHDGRTSYLIKESRSGLVLDMLECGPTS